MGSSGGYRDVEVVAGQQPHLSPAVGCRKRHGLEFFDASVLTERRKDRDPLGPGKERLHVAQKWVVRPASHQCFSSGIDSWARHEVVAFARYDMPHATARIRDVARKARDHMHVQVWHGLAGSGAGVDADVVAVGAQFGVELTLDGVDEGENRDLLVCRGVEPSRDESVRHHQRVAKRNRVAIADSKRQVVGGDPAVLGQL